MTSDERAGFAGVDIGGSGLRLRVELDNRRVERQRAVPVPRREGRIDIRSLCSLILDELHPAMAELGVTRLQGLGLGMTGVPGLVENTEELSCRLRAHHEFSVVVIASDALTTHLGALDGESGAVVAAGTGAITLGTDFQKTWHQVDGWGTLLGDEGSGAWIGRAGLQAALRSSDGRIGGSDHLRLRMHDHFGEPLDLVDRIYSAESPAHALASFAPAVETAARADDPIATSIWHEAGVLLAQGAVAAVRELPLRISWGGGLFRAGDLLVDPFRAEVFRALPEVDLREPAGNALDGALLLARQAATGTIETDGTTPHLHIFSDVPHPQGGPSRSSVKVS